MSDTEIKNEKTTGKGGLAFLLLFIGFVVGFIVGHVTRDTIVQSMVNVILTEQESLPPPPGGAVPPSTTEAVVPEPVPPSTMEP